MICPTCSNNSQFNIIGSMGNDHYVRCRCCGMDFYSQAQDEDDDCDDVEDTDDE